MEAEGGGAAMNDNMGWLVGLVWVLWLALGMKAVLGRFQKRRAEKEEAKLRNELRAQREHPDIPTAAENIFMELSAARRFAVRGENWTLTANPIIAKNLLNEDLGKFGSRSDTQPLNDETRDILIAHARRDAAEAMLNTQSLLKEVHQLKKSRDELYSQLFWGVAGLILFSWWKVGFAIPDWLRQLL